MKKYRVRLVQKVYYDCEVEAETLAKARLAVSTDLECGNDPDIWEVDSGEMEIDLDYEPYECFDLPGTTG